MRSPPTLERRQKPKRKNKTNNSRFHLFFFCFSSYRAKEGEMPIGYRKRGERWENTLLEVVFRIQYYLRESNFFSYSETSTLLFLRKCIWEKETLDSGREKIAPEAQKRVWEEEEEEENFNLAGENLVSRRRRRCMQGVRFPQIWFFLSPSSRPFGATKSSQRQFTAPLLAAIGVHT